MCVSMLVFCLKMGVSLFKYTLIGGMLLMKCQKILL